MGVSFNDDGTCILSRANNGTVKLWDEALNLLATLDHGATSINDFGNKILSASLNKNNDRILTVDKNDRACLWDYEGRLVNEIVLNESFYDECYAFLSPCNNYILTSTGLENARIWNTRGDCLEIECNFHTDEAIWSPYGNYILVRSNRCEVALAKIHHGNKGLECEVIAILKHFGKVLHFEFSTDEQHILTSTLYTNEVVVWNNQGKRLTTIHQPLKHEDPYPDRWRIECGLEQLASFGPEKGTVLIPIRKDHKHFIETWFYEIPVA